MYAIVVLDVGFRCSRGDPEPFEPSALRVTPAQIDGLTEFLAEYGIEHDGSPRWLLMSYRG